MRVSQEMFLIPMYPEFGQSIQFSSSLIASTLCQLSETELMVLFLCNTFAEGHRLTINQAPNLPKFQHYEAGFASSNFFSSRISCHSWPTPQCFMVFADNLATQRSSVSLYFSSCLCYLPFHKFLSLYLFFTDEVEPPLGIFLWLVWQN